MGVNVCMRYQQGLTALIIHLILILSYFLTVFTSGFCINKTSVRPQCGHLPKLKTLCLKWSHLRNCRAKVVISKNLEGGFPPKGYRFSWFWIELNMNFLKIGINKGIDFPIIDINFIKTFLGEIWFELTYYSTFKDI